VSGDSPGAEERRCTCVELKAGPRPRRDHAFEFKDKTAMLIPQSIVDGAGRHYLGEERRPPQRAPDKQRN